MALNWACPLRIEQVDAAEIPPCRAFAQKELSTLRVSAARSLRAGYKCARHRRSPAFRYTSDLGLGGRAANRRNDCLPADFPYRSLAAWDRFERPTTNGWSVGGSRLPSSGRTRCHSAISMLDRTPLP